MVIEWFCTLYGLWHAVGDFLCVAYVVVYDQLHIVIEDLHSVSGVGMGEGQIPRSRNVYISRINLDGYHRFLL